MVYFPNVSVLNYTYTHFRLVPPNQSELFDFKNLSGFEFQFQEQYSQSAEGVLTVERLQGSTPQQTMRVVEHPGGVFMEDTISPQETTCLIPLPVSVGKTFCDSSGEVCIRQVHPDGTLEVVSKISSRGVEGQMLSVYAPGAWLIYQKIQSNKMEYEALQDGLGQAWLLANPEANS